MILLAAAIASAAQIPEGEKQVPRRAEQQDRNSSAGNDMRADLEKMHNLLALMQRNVAFVSTGDTPLKHQLELEIEMWQLLLRDMERKWGPADTSPSSSAH